ncbi:hypothetical protein [Rhizobium sp. BG6]|uniref:hypothetical protein n=1 Tax=Rhizobium sp. BG6 TaxID=2613771 RepID=UPI00193DB2EB|nr:hypothetical protein [Rhizobium sp. BG6]
MSRRMSLASLPIERASIWPPLIVVVPVSATLSDPRRTPLVTPLTIMGLRTKPSSSAEPLSDPPPTSVAVSGPVTCTLTPVPASIVAKAAWGDRRPDTGRD